MTLPTFYNDPFKINALFNPKFIVMVLTTHIYHVFILKMIERITNEELHVHQNF